ncbi:hypothetical protein SeLEV6574_g05686 [Synchytrium endobioticum]|uniref:Uncharacterized protein n=1 Tax=Synchytrium endobioticum TaxID=286115 RepID=A0A507CSY0_9FUNG|nr:hypothetical protein SeLEV6574_g05686 [Synchytrium endobioticum]
MRLRRKRGQEYARARLRVPHVDRPITCTDYFLATYLAAASRVFNFSQRGSQKFGSETSTSYAAIDSIGSIGNSIIRNCQHSLVAASPSFNHRHQLSPLGGGWMYLVPSRQPYIVKYGGARLYQKGGITNRKTKIICKLKSFASYGFYTYIHRKEVIELE